MKSVMTRCIPKTKVKCKPGLNVAQEIEARTIRKKLLDESKREEVYEQLREVFDCYKYGTTFDSYLKKVNPSLYSACKRTDIQFRIIDRCLIIDM